MVTRNATRKVTKLELAEKPAPNRKIFGLDVAAWKDATAGLFLWPFKSEAEMIEYAEKRHVDLGGLPDAEGWSDDEIRIVVALIVAYTRADDDARLEREDGKSWGMPLGAINSFAEQLGKSTYATEKSKDNDVDTLFQALEEAGVAYWYSPFNRDKGRGGRPIVRLGKRTETGSKIGRSLAILIGENTEK